MFILLNYILHNYILKYHNYFKENNPLNKFFFLLIKYRYRFFVLWITHYINAITCIIYNISAMYNFLFYVIFVKSALSFLSFYEAFFSYMKMNLSQHSLWSAFVHVPRFSLQKWLCLLRISFFIVVFTKSLSLEIFT